MIDAGDARGADCLPVDRADRARGVRPGAEIVVDDVDRRSPGALPYLGELRTGVVEDVIDDLHARIRREIGVRIAVAIDRKSVGWGKRVFVGEDPGGGGSDQKKIKR